MSVKALCQFFESISRQSGSPTMPFAQTGLCSNKASLLCYKSRTDSYEDLASVCPGQSRHKDNALSRIQRRIRRSSCISLSRRKRKRSESSSGSSISSVSTSISSDISIEPRTSSDEGLGTSIRHRLSKKASSSRLSSSMNSTFNGSNTSWLQELQDLQLSSSTRVSSSLARRSVAMDDLPVRLRRPCRAPIYEDGEDSGLYHPLFQEWGLEQLFWQHLALQSGL